MEPNEVLKSDKNPKWVAGLRCHDDYHAERLQRVLNAEGVEKFEAAKLLLRDHDKKGGNLMQNLAKGDELYKEYLKARQSKRITIDSNTKKSGDDDESDFLLSKKELLARAIGSMDAPPPVLQKRPVGIGLRSRELWSPKSSHLYGMLSSIVDLDKSINFAAFDHLNSNTFIGIPNTFRASISEPGHMEKYFSAWSYFNKSFVMNKDVLLSVEFENQIIAPIIAAAELAAHVKIPTGQKGPGSNKSSLKSQQKLYDKYLLAFKRDPLGAAGKTILGVHDPMRDPPVGGAIMAYNASSVPLRGVLKGMTRNGDMHFRPLCTTGDLLLALYELSDSEIFEDGFVQLLDTPLFEKKGAFVVPSKDAYSSVSKGTPRLVYRLVHRLQRPDTWFMARFKPTLLTKDLNDYACPQLCSQAFEFVSIHHDSINSEMKRASYVIQCALLGDTPENAKVKTVLKSVVIDFEVVFPNNPNENSDLLAMRNKLANDVSMQKDVENVDVTSDLDFQLRLLHVVELEKGERRTGSMAGNGVLGLAQKKFLAKKRAQTADDGSASGVTFKALNSTDKPNDSNSALVTPSTTKKKGKWDLSDVILSAADSPTLQQPKPRRHTPVQNKVSLVELVKDVSVVNPLDMTLDQRQAAMRKNIRDLLESAKTYVETYGISEEVTPINPVKKRKSTSQTPKSASRRESRLVIADKAQLEALTKSRASTSTNTPHSSRRNSVAFTSTMAANIELLSAMNAEVATAAASEGTDTSKASGGARQSGTVIGTAQAGASRYISSNTRHESISDNSGSSSNSDSESDSDSSERKLSLRRGDNTKDFDTCKPKKRNYSKPKRPLNQFFGAVKSAIAKKARSLIDEFGGDESCGDSDSDIDNEYLVEQRRKKLIDVVVAREMAAVNPLNRLLELIDRTIQEGVDPYIMHRKMYGVPVSEKPLLQGREDEGKIPDITTHNALKISLHKGSNMRYRVDGGFVGPLRDIYAYKMETSRKTEAERAKNRAAVVQKAEPSANAKATNSTGSALEEDDFSVHTQVSEISVNSILRRHTHRRLTKIAKTQTPQRPVLHRRSSSLANIQHSSPAPEELSQSHRKSRADVQETSEQLRNVLPATNAESKSDVSNSSTSQRPHAATKQADIQFSTERNYTKAKHNPFDEAYYLEHLSRSSGVLSANSRYLNIEKSTHSESAGSSKTAVHKQDDEETPLVLKDTPRMFSTTRSVGRSKVKTKVAIENQEDSVPSGGKDLLVSETDRVKKSSRKKTGGSKASKKVTTKRGNNKKKKHDAKNKKVLTARNHQPVKNQGESQPSKEGGEGKSKDAVTEVIGCVGISTSCGSGVAEVDRGDDGNDEDGDEGSETLEEEGSDDDTEGNEEGDLHDDAAADDGDASGDDAGDEEQEGDEEEEELDEEDVGEGDVEDGILDYGVDDVYDALEAYEAQDTLEHASERHEMKSTELSSLTGVDNASARSNRLSFLFDILEADKRSADSFEAAAERFRSQQRMWAVESERMLENLVSRLDPMMGVEEEASRRGEDGINYESTVTLNSVVGMDDSIASTIASVVEEAKVDDGVSPEVVETADEVNYNSDDDEEALLLELQSTLLDSALTTGTTSELQSALDDIEARRKTVVNRKMEQVKELSKLFLARQNADKFRKERVLDAADRRAMEQREKMERDEKLAQARILEQIYRRVKFLQTHIVDLATTAKLPYPSKEKTRKKMRRKKKRHLMNRRRTHPTPEARKKHYHIDDTDCSHDRVYHDITSDRDTFDSSHEADRSEELLIRGAMLSESVATGSSHGGRLWGPLLSTSNFLSTGGERRFGEAMFDSLGDDDTGANNYLQAALLAAEYGYLSSSAVEEVISLYDPEELLRLRSDIMQELTRSQPSSPVKDRNHFSPYHSRNSKSSSLGEMTAIKQTASHFVNALVSSVMVGITAEQSFNEIEFLSADDMMSLASRYSADTNKSDKSLDQSRSHFLSQTIYDIKDLQSPNPHIGIGFDSPYLASIQSSDTMPHIRVDVQGESIHTSEVYIPTASDDISLSSVHPVDLALDICEYSAVDFQSHALPAREIKRLGNDKMMNSKQKTALPFVAGGKVELGHVAPSTVDRQPSPTRVRGGADNTAIEAGIFGIDGQRVPSPLRVISTTVSQDVAQALLQLTDKPGSPINIPVLSDFPHRPKSHQASRYGGASKHRVLVTSNVAVRPSDCSPIDGMRFATSDLIEGPVDVEVSGLCSANDKESFRGLLYTAGGESFTQPTAADPVGYDLFQPAKDETVDQDKTRVVFRDTPETIRPRLRGPTDIVVIGSEAAAASTRGNIWKGGNGAYYEPATNPNIAANAKVGGRSIQSEEISRNELVLSFPFLRDVQPDFKDMSDDDATDVIPGELSADVSITSSKHPDISDKSYASRIPMESMHVFQLDSHSVFQPEKNFGAVPLIPPSPAKVRPHSQHSPIPMHSHFMDDGDRDYINVSKRPMSRAATAFQRDRKEDDNRVGNSDRRGVPRTLEDIYQVSSLRPLKPSTASASTGLHQYSRQSDTSRAQTSDAGGYKQPYSKEMLANPQGYVPRPPSQQKEVSHMRDNIRGKGRRLRGRK